MIGGPHPRPHGPEHAGGGAAPYFAESLRPSPTNNPATDRGGDLGVLVSPAMDDMRQGNCPLCAHDEILATEPLEFSGEFHTERRMRAAWGRKTETSWLQGDREVLDKEQPYGDLSLFICRACGFAQWFVDKPGDIPVGEEAGTRLVRGKKKTPFR